MITTVRKMSKRVWSMSRSVGRMRRCAQMIIGSVWRIKMNLGRMIKIVGKIIGLSIRISKYMGEG